jgi:hypothetical protein
MLFRSHSISTANVAHPKSATIDKDHRAIRLLLPVDLADLVKIDY